MKKVIIVIIIVMAAAAAVAHFQFHADPDIDELNFTQRIFTRSILNNFEATITLLPAEKRAIVDYDFLLDNLNYFQRDLAERILAIPPSQLGFKGPFFSLEKPDSLIAIPSYNLGDLETGINYSPVHSYNDLMIMNDSMKKDIGRILYIDSGYRSPGRQAYLFFYYLVNSNEYSLSENAKWIAMPGYSEHGAPVNNAFDFVSDEGINGFHRGQSAVDFESLPEFRWLEKNASRFNFFLTYPRNNGLGVAYEPWHWHWENSNH